MRDIAFYCFFVIFFYNLIDPEAIKENLDKRQKRNFIFESGSRRFAVWRFVACSLDKSHKKSSRNGRYIQCLSLSISWLIKYLRLIGMENAHIKDAAALCCFFAWLEKEVESQRTVTEISAADKLAGFRAEQADFVGLSFDTISSSGSNAGMKIRFFPSSLWIWYNNSSLTCNAFLHLYSNHSLQANSWIGPAHHRPRNLSLRFGWPIQGWNDRCDSHSAFWNSNPVREAVLYSCPQGTNEFSNMPISFQSESNNV